MEHRVPTIFEFAEQRRQKARPEGERKLKPARKGSGKTSRRPAPKRTTKKPTRRR